MRPISNAILSVALGLPGPVLCPAQHFLKTGDLVPQSHRKLAPDFHLTDRNGNPCSLGTHPGHVVLLDFWATTCRGCKLELPWYRDFQSRYAGKGFDLLDLDMYGEVSQVVRGFATEQHLTYPLAIGTDQIGFQYHLAAMPLTMLIDKQGRIAAAHAGVVDKP